MNGCGEKSFTVNPIYFCFSHSFDFFLLFICFLFRFLRSPSLLVPFILILRVLLFFRWSMSQSKKKRKRDRGRTSLRHIVILPWSHRIVWVISPFQKMNVLLLCWHLSSPPPHFSHPSPFADSISPLPSSFLISLSSILSFPLSFFPLYAWFVAKEFIVLSWISCCCPEGDEKVSWIGFSWKR